MLTVELIALLVVSTVHVAPSGSDSNSGSATLPVAGLPRAVEIARRTGAKIIQLAPGTYTLSETLRLGPEDNGLTVRGPATLSGGMPVTNWTQDRDGTWSAPVPTGKTFRLLVVDGKMRERARWPESGRLEHESVFDVRWMSTTGGGWQRKPTDAELTEMIAKAGDLPAGFEPKNAEVTVYHMWDESMVGVKTFERGSRKLTFSSPLGHPPGAFGVKSYVVWNIREGLTKPGQWFHDRARDRIVVRPLPGENLEEAEAWVPTVNTLLQLDNTQGVTIRDLKLTLCDSPLKMGGFGAGDYPGAIMAAAATRLTLEGLSIENVGGWGVRVWDAHDGRIQAVNVAHTGAGGLRAVGDRLRIEDSRVSHVGLMYPSSLGIWGGGNQAVVAHNHISDTPYSGIIADGEGTVIENNLIERVMNVLHDGGGIYTGFHAGIVVRGNVVRDIDNTGGYGAAAYYFDEAAHGYVLEGNLSIGVPEVSRNHMAYDNTIRDNVFLVEGPAQLTFARSRNYTLERNVVIARESVELRAPAEAFGSLGPEAIAVGPVALVRAMLVDYGEQSKETVRQGDFESLGTLDGLKWTPSPELAALGYKPMDWSNVGPRR